MGNEDLPKIREWSVRFFDQKVKGSVAKGLSYPIVDMLCDLGFRCRFFAVSCWTKCLGGGRDV